MPSIETSCTVEPLGDWLVYAETPVMGSGVPRSTSIHCGAWSPAVQLVLAQFPSKALSGGWPPAEPLTAKLGCTKFESGPTRHEPPSSQALPAHGLNVS